MINAKVAEWLREAAASINYWSNGEGERFRQRAKQVEAMTCDRCRWWGEEQNYLALMPKGYRNCYSLNSPLIVSPAKFGCTHWEEKKK